MAWIEDRFDSRNMINAVPTFAQMSRATGELLEGISWNDTKLPCDYSRHERAADAAEAALGREHINFAKINAQRRQNRDMQDGEKRRS